MTTTYLVLLIGNEGLWEAQSPDQQADVFRRHHEFAVALAERGHTITGGAELTHSRTTTQVRLVDGEVVVTEGPYAESVEQLGGYYCVETDDLDDLRACTEMLLDADGAIEIRATTEATA